MDIYITILVSCPFMKSGRRFRKFIFKKPFLALKIILKNVAAQSMGERLETLSYLKNTPEAKACAIIQAVEIVFNISNLIKNYLFKR